MGQLNETTAEIQAAIDKAQALPDYHDAETRAEVFNDTENNTAGTYGHAEGIQTAAGDYGHAEGNRTSTGDTAHAEGYQTHALGQFSHTEGSDTEADGARAHAEGFNTKADAENSHAEGSGSHVLPDGDCGHAEGASLIEFYGFHGVVSREGSFDGLALNVLSAGEDRAFRTFHVLRDPLSGELSQGPAGKRQKLQGVQGSTRTAGMQGSSETTGTTGTAGTTGPTGTAGTAGMGDGRLPRITCFAYSEGREKDWANVVTCHEGSASVLVSPFPR